MLFIGIMIVIGLAHWLVYTALLWMMIKLQKMNYNLLGLLGSSVGLRHGSSADDVDRCRRLAAPPEAAERTVAAEGGVL